MTIEIERLPFGERAADNVDCIHLQTGDNGRVYLTGSALKRGEGEDAQSVSIIGGEPYESAQAAEDAGVTWAAEQGVQQLYVSTSDQPV